MSELQPINNNDLDKLLKLASKNNDSISALVNGYKNLSKHIEKTDKEIKEIQEDINQLKFNEEITDSQAGVITSMVKQLAKDTTGYPNVLYRYAVHDIYKHLTERWGMGNKVRTTKKGNYETVIEGIRSYKPDINKLKERCTKAQQEEIKRISDQLESERA